MISDYSAPAFLHLNDSSWENHKVTFCNSEGAFHSYFFWFIFVFLKWTLNILLHMAFSLHV